MSVDPYQMGQMYSDQIGSGPNMIMNQAMMNPALSQVSQQQMSQVSQAQMSQLSQSASALRLNQGFLYLSPFICMKSN